MKRILGIACFLFSGILFAQLPCGDTAVSLSRRLGLWDVLAMSEGSAEAQIARHTFLASHWEYEVVRKEILPTLSFSGTLPQISRTFSKTTLPDGRETFVPQFYGDYSGGLQLSQFIPQTNTTITVGTSLERLDVYGGERSKSYLATPFGVGISQSLFTYNASRWERKLNPVKYSAARQRYLQEREAVYGRAAELYFDLLMAQEAYRSAAEDRAYADTLFVMAQEKYAGGRIVESELLEVELNALQAGYEMETLYDGWQEALMALKDFLVLEDEAVWELSVPGSRFFPGLSVRKALEEAQANNALYHEFRQREIEAEANLMRSRTENQFSMEIYASFGLNQNAGTLAGSYMDLLDQEMVSVGLNIPIVDWGRAKGRINMAKSEKEVERLRIAQEERDLEREIAVTVTSFSSQGRKVELARRSLEVAGKRLELEKLLHGMARTDFSRYRDARVDKDNSLGQYLEALKQYWLLYYAIREKTLYDFSKGEKIEVSFEELLRDSK